MSQDGLQTLGTDDADAKRESLAAALREGGARAVAEFERCLGDGDWRVRKEALAAVGSIPADRLYPLLVAGVVQSENVGLRNAAIEAASVVGDALVPSLVEAFAREVGAPRRFVASALGMTASLSAVPTLVVAVDDADENLAAAAIDALARIGGPDAERAVKAELEKGDAYRRMSALDALERMRASAPFELLAPCLADPVLRRVALAMLGRTRDERAVPVLLAALSDRSATAVAAAAAGLEELAEATDELADRVHAAARELPAPALTALKKVVVEGDHDARRAAATLLIAARSVESLPLVLGLAAEESLPTSALMALSAWGAAAIGPLLEVVGGWRGAVSAIALELAADLGAGLGVSDEDRRLIRVLLRESLDARDELLRDAALRCFGEHAEADDIPRLVRIAASSRAEDALRAAAVLERFVESHRAAVESAVASIDPAEGGGALCSVLAAIGTDDALDRIVACVGASDPRARRQAVVALSGAAGARALETLALALADEDLDVRATAAMVLGQLRDPEGRPVGTERLLSALEHGEPAVQVAALRALVDLGATQAREPAAHLALTAAPDVAAAALAALRALGSDRTTEVALEAARSGHPEVVVAALAALADRALPAKAAPFVVECIDHPAWEARLAAIRVLRGMPDGPALLRRRLAEETDDIVRRALVEATEGDG